ncbi:hypothetical protein BJ912DRAFT_305687 [Pholiota molesta]|nr:hypothetical protein BJ912DRAFT_305687 [Pholiota molesta]
MQVALHLYPHISSFVLKIRSNRATFIALIVLAWDVVLLIPLIGRFMLQKPELGRYYGIADEWCWINYHDERIFLECVFVSRNKISFCMNIKHVHKMQNKTRARNVVERESESREQRSLQCHSLARAVACDCCGSIT